MTAATTKILLHDHEVSLRPVEPTDLDRLVMWENDTRIWSAGATIAPFSRKIMWDYIENYNPDIYVARQLRLMVCLQASGETVGMIDLYDFDPQNRRAGVGVMVAPDYWHHGYGTRALMLIVDYAFRHIGMHQLWSVVAVDNQYSMRLFRKCGFDTCGRLRSWLRRGRGYCDAYMFQRLEGV